MEHVDTLGLLGRILEHAKVAITVVDQEGLLTCFNRAAERLTGFSREEVLGSHVARFYPDPAELGRLWERLRAGGKVEDYETTLLDKDGAEVPVSIVLVPLTDEAGQPMGSLGLTRDLTDRHRLERELREARQRVELCNALVCHDMRNYIQATHGFLEVLLAGRPGPLTEEQRRLLGICRRQLARARDLIHRVTLLEDLEARGEIPLAAQPLAPLFERVAQAVRENYVDRRPEVTLVLPEGEALAVLGTELVYELVYNLASNAVAHNPAKTPRVWLSARLAGPEAPGRVRLVVEDDGPGLEPRRCERLFEELCERHPRGAGSGLCLVRSLAERFGGRVFAEDRVAGAPGRGARFVVELRDASASC